MHHDMMPHNWGWGGGMGILWLLFLVLLIFAVMWTVREFAGQEASGGSRAGPPADRESPREILDRRFAEGELTREEYEQKKQDLET